jgi:hypothetical protein
MIRVERVRGVISVVGGEIGEGGVDLHGEGGTSHCGQRCLWHVQVWHTHLEWCLAISSQGIVLIMME